MKRHHPLLLAPRSLLLLALCPLLFAFANAQTTSATLSGTVEDEQGAVIPGAEVTVLNPSTALQRQTTTNGQGYFTVTLLPPGTYTVTVRRDGFAPIEAKNVILNVGDQKALQIQLKAGDVNATIQVINEAPLIEESPAVSTVVDRQFVENMPLNGRSFQSLIQLAPGVVLTKATDSNAGQFSVNGQRADANYFTVDGASANIGVAGGTQIVQAGGGALPGLSVAGGTNNLVSVDAMQEFRI